MIYRVKYNPKKDVEVCKWLIENVGIQQIFVDWADFVCGNEKSILLEFEHSTYDWCGFCNRALNTSEILLKNKEKAVLFKLVWG